MLIHEYSSFLVSQQAISSKHLKRYVIADLYIPKQLQSTGDVSLLIINDGQDLEEMNFANILERLHVQNAINSIFIIALHANKDRRQEYGTAATLDYAGRGLKSQPYQDFITSELLQFLVINYQVQFSSINICGFSLGGLSAMDTAWNNPGIFNRVGIFSGSLWWRSHKIDDTYDDHLHRIMHLQIRNSTLRTRLKFYFTTGSMDETADRNNNGIIDSIDDTLDLIKELKQLGYTDNDIYYINYTDGKHDVPTWGRAMPDFLKWGWGSGV